MPLLSHRATRIRRRVIFSHKRASFNTTEALPLPRESSAEARIVVSTAMDNESPSVFDETVWEQSGEKMSFSTTLPSHLSNYSTDLFSDEIPTATYQAQRDTMSKCLPLLTSPESLGLPMNAQGLPHLARERHTAFLHNTLRALPEPYVAADATRPWMFYWAIAGLSFLDQDVSEYKDRLIETLRPLQNNSGGFGGGHGQMSHCACTYASVLALACVDGLNMVDRKSLWHWLGSVKQADGGFRMAVDAEEDIRGAYCAMTVITLLNIPLVLPPGAPARQAGLELFTDGLGDWIAQCQTYEGGIAGAPGNEAHGAYAFCALACLSILDAPFKSIPHHLDLPALVDCLASLQTSPEGGFAGRTNKLVDACYSHWVGGCWSLLEAACVPDANTTVPAPSSSDPSPRIARRSLWNRAADIRYLLCCCQSPFKRGGMRDKPSEQSDGYHTCYSLSGLSAAQNHYTFASHSAMDTDMSSLDENSGRLTAAFQWSARRPSTEELDEWLLDDKDVVAFVHPVFVIPMEVVRRAEAQFANGAF